MPKKKEYKAVTYGMRYEQYVKILDKQLNSIKEYDGYNDLNEDVKVLKKTKVKKSVNLICDIRFSYPKTISEI